MSNFGKPLTTPMRVSDYNQNNPNKSDHIKNRPFYQDGDVIKKLDEKFIPDSIARTEDVKKLINEGGGNGSGDTVQTDYLQNDATQPDFLKHRPFYKEKILLTEGKVEVIYGQYGEDKWVEGANMPAGELPNIEVDGVLKVLVEVNDNGEISTETGYFDGWSIMNGDGAYVSICDGKAEIGYLEGDNIHCDCWEEIGDVTINIFMENIKKMDKEFLPSDINTVPYIAGDGSFLGTPEPSELPSGPCILYGMLGKAVNIHYFEENPTLCNVIQREDGLTVIQWFEEDEVYLGGMLARYLVTTDDEVIEDRAISLTDLDEAKSAAYELAYDASTEADEAKQAVAEALAGIDGAMAYASEAIDIAMSVSETADAADQNVTMIMNGDYYFDSITMADSDGGVYSVKVGTDGNLKVTKLF